MSAPKEFSESFKLDSDKIPFSEGKKRWTDLDQSQIYWPVMRWAGVELPSFNMYEAPGWAFWEVLGMQRFLRQSPCHWEANALARETPSDGPPSGFQGWRRVSHLLDLQIQPVARRPEKPAREPHLKKVTSPDEKRWMEKGKGLVLSAGMMGLVCQEGQGCDGM